MRRATLEAVVAATPEEGAAATLAAAAVVATPEEGAAVTSREAATPEAGATSVAAGTAWALATSPADT